MFDLLYTIAAFIVALGLLIAVHEFGHYWVARKMGVKVLRFSIGFGKPLLRAVRGSDQTEYVLAGIPLGGYVRMLDEREGEVDPSERHRAFNNQPVGKRIAIVAAGPVFNLIFAVLAYWAMFVVGVPGLKPIIGDVAHGTPAYSAGLKQGDQVVAVEGNATPTWSALLNELLPYAIDRRAVTLTVERDGVTHSALYPLDELRPDFEPDQLRQHLGLNPYRPAIPPRVHEVTADGPGARGGLLAHDLFLSIDGQAIDEWQQVVDAIRSHPSQALAVVVARDGQRVALTITPDAREEGDTTIGHMGVAVEIDEAHFAHLSAELRYGPIEAVGQAVHKMVDVSWMTLRLLGRMLTGDISVKHVSGPVTIAQYAGASAEAGLSQFFGFLAIVSVSLGILNLLPIPVLDGGHLFFYSIELLKGSPLSEQAQLAGQKIGLVLLMGMMLLALYNDFMRLAS